MYESKILPVPLSPAQYSDIPFGDSDAPEQLRRMLLLQQPVLPAHRRIVILYSSHHPPYSITRKDRENTATHRRSRPRKPHEPDACSPAGHTSRLRNLRRPGREFSEPVLRCARKLILPLSLHRFPMPPSMRGRGLKGNAVRIGNSSRCCKFLSGNGHMRDRQSQPLVKTGKAS